MYKIIAILVVLAGISPSLFAQPNGAPDYSKGCHHAWHAKDMEPLTPEQEVAMAVSAERSDTIDIINYHIDLDFSDFSSSTIVGITTIEFKPILPASKMRLNLHRL